MLMAVAANAADNPTIESLRSSAFAMPKAEAVVPSAPAPVAVEQPVQVPQDLVYKFNQLKNDMWRLESDTTWLRSDIDRLEGEARRIQQGSHNAFFSNDLRNMARNLNSWSNDAQRLAFDLKRLLPLAVKDKKLNDLARDIEWDVRDLDNRFQFDVQNSAQRLEWTVRSIDSNLVGYDAQWQASDISRYARDIQQKTRDMRWDAQDLVRKTQP
ncbi:MAG TPA: hypothetical protein DDW67_10170 [Elusimicrobia bacterium]|nr:hypothetical protein [Elusimicrobiota bacterium]